MVAAGGRADVLDKLERDCAAGDIAACGHAGGTLVERYPKGRRTPAINVRIFNAWSRACDAKMWAACQRLTSELGGDPDPTAAFAIADRVCRAGYWPSCLEVVKLLPEGDRAKTLEWICYQLEKADGTWVSWQWQSTMLACTHLSNAVMGSDPVRQRQLLIISAMAGHESVEAAWAESDAIGARSAVQIDQWREQAAADERKRQATLSLIVQGTGQVAGAVRQMGAQLDQARATQHQLETRTHPLNRPPISSFPRSPSSASASPPPATSPQASHYSAPSLRGGMTQNAAPAGSVPVAQATRTQIDNARQQCMQQPVMDTHVTENNVFAVHAKRYETLREEAQQCPNSTQQVWAECIGANFRLWPDAAAQMDIDHTVARAAKVNVPFPSIPGLSRTRDDCVARGKNNCYYDLNYKIMRLWEAYNHYQGVVDGETRARKHAAEQARDDECRRRYP